VSKSRAELAAEAKIEAAKVLRAIMDAVSPFIDALPERGTNDEIEPKLAGLLFGVRAYMAEFKGLEAHVLAELVRYGHVSAEDYAAGVQAADVLGLVVIEKLAASMGGL